MDGQDAPGFGWYPRDAKRSEDRLKDYAAQFPLVEVDSTYYALPTPQLAQFWCDRTPKNFTFHIKAYRVFTAHQTNLETLPPDLQHALLNKVKDTFYKEDLPGEIADERWKQFRAALNPYAVRATEGRLTAGTTGRMRRAHTIPAKSL